MTKPERKVPSQGSEGDHKIHCNNKDNILDLIDFKRFSKIPYIILEERESEPPSFQKIFSYTFLGTKMIKQIERQVRELQKELSEAQKERNLLRLQPCQGDLEIRQKEEGLDNLDKRIESLNQQVRELDRKRREIMSEAIKKPGYESPFN